jgi:hypothetical protein
VFESRLSSSPNVLLFKKGSDELYVLWETENMTVTDRPYFTERTSTYSVPKNGILRRLVDDSSGMMSSESYVAGTPLTVNAKPLFVVASSQQIVLPVQLISFAAEKANKTVILKYVVRDAEEVEVERSTDGRNFISLGTGIFNKLVDMHPAYGRNYYRLKMYNDTGSFTYSHILTVQFTGINLPVIMYNVAGQAIRKGYSSDVDRWEAEVLPGTPYYLIYGERDHAFTEVFIKQ